MHLGFFKQTFLDSAFRYLSVVELDRWAELLVVVSIFAISVAVVGQALRRCAGRAGRCSSGLEGSTKSKDFSPSFRWVLPRLDDKRLSGQPHLFGHLLLMRLSQLLVTLKKIVEPSQGATVQRMG